MISYLKGTVKEISSETATILISSGVGYEVSLTVQDIASLKINTHVELFCYTHITDRTHQLFGFTRKDVRDLFKLLTSQVSGVGPKSALKLLSKKTYDVFFAALSSGDFSQIEALGIGKKTAEKIIIGLKGKLFHETKHTPSSQSHKEAIDALENLGYSYTEAQKALQGIEMKGKTSEEIIKLALKSI